MPSSQQNERRANKSLFKGNNKKLQRRLYSLRTDYQTSNFNKVTETQEQQHALNLKSAEIAPLNSSNPESAADDTVQEDKIEKQGKILKPTAIKVVNAAGGDIKPLVLLLKDNNINDFLLKLDGNVLSIFPENLKVCHQIKKVLDTQKVEFFSHTSKIEKPISRVLKGLHGGFNEQQVMNAINELEIPEITVKKVSKLIFNKKKPSLYHFTVQITNESNLNNLVKIKNLLNHEIEWQKPYKQLVFQCSNCQRVGHGSINCHLGYRCVKCAESHGPGKCTVATDNKENFKCANCLATGHAASYKGCPYLKAAEKNRKQFRRLNTELKKRQTGKKDEQAQSTITSGT